MRRLAAVVVVVVIIVAVVLVVNMFILALVLVFLVVVVVAADVVDVDVDVQVSHTLELAEFSKVNFHSGISNHTVLGGLFWLSKQVSMVTFSETSRYISIYIYTVNILCIYIYCIH